MKTKRNLSDGNPVLPLSATNTPEDDDEIQTSLAPYIQTYLSHSSGRSSCGCLPVPFERAAEHSWIRPCFDSDILEGQFRTSSFPQFTRRFRYALIYIIVVSLIFLVYNGVRYSDDLYTPIIFSIICFLMCSSLYLSFQDVYHDHVQTVAMATALTLAVACLLFCFSGGSTLSHFTMVNWTVIVIYTIFPLPPYVSLIICTVLCATFQAVEYFYVDFYAVPYGLIIRLLCLVCVNIIGFHIVVMVHVRMRGTFMKVGQRLLVRRQLEAEKQLKEKMIHSVMPPKVAGWLLNPNPSLTEGQSTSAGDIRSLFRPFNMVRMDDVSILFADIVGFTRMSSNKTAEEIVDILNDLFERFDDLCLLSGCEKISTLGDCYYCVSGCPEPREDHAKCCVEMGLGMIDAIQEFDIERGENVNMRVGVHTGTVLCGVVGTRRFKFDVWSNDVSFANKLESTGVAGRVHVSEQTVKFLQGDYRIEEFETSLDVKTYLIEARDPPQPAHVRVALPPSSPLASQDNNRVTSPGRTRLNSCQAGGKRPHYLSLITGARTKFASLPNVLESTNASSSPRKSSSIKWQFPFARTWRDQPHPDTINLESVEQKQSLQRLTLPKTECLRVNTEEEVSLCPSANSRKDSGIKSSSRRSSIQQQLYLMNGLAQQELLTNRVSGYFTSSRSSLPHSESDFDVPLSFRLPPGDSLGTCFYSLRKQSDLQLIRCVRDCDEKSFFARVPLRKLTLNFRSEKLEDDYRKHAHNVLENLGDSPATLSTSRYNTYLDILVSTIVFTSVLCGLIILNNPPSHFFILSAIAGLMQLLALLLFTLCLRDNLKLDRPWRARIVSLFSEWYPWHAIGGVLVSLPIFLTLAAFSCRVYHQQQTGSLTNTPISLEFLEGSNLYLPGFEFNDYYYTFLVLVSLTHFCNFTQLNFFMKSFTAVASILLFLSLTFIEKCQLTNKQYVATVFLSRFISENIFINSSVNLYNITECCDVFTDIIPILSNYDAQTYFNVGDQFLDNFYHNNGSESVFYVTYNGLQFFKAINNRTDDFVFWKNSVVTALAQYVTYDYYELVLNIGILLFLIILLNREFEINYRASYYFNVESNKDKIHVQYLKNQADMLLENIIPKYVSVELKNRAKYCENHSDVGIIFASIVNFNKLYDETYSGGKEYLRYLNELISDFDELLSLKRFRNVEKIKTIGSTFMAASGLNPELRKQNLYEYEHLHELIEFAKEMYRVVDDFNCELLGFNLILRVGFNVGEVTAGVIGSSKLLYDIWGDPVNVASRMDTTGVEGRVQVPYSSLKYLSDRYHFEPRGSVYVKGKGDIMVYLLKY